MNRLPIDLLYEIASFFIPIRYTIRNDVEKRVTDKNDLCSHPRAVRYVRDYFSSLPKNKYKPISSWFHISQLSSNPSEEAIAFLIQNHQHIIWNQFGKLDNYLAVDYILSTSSTLPWSYICDNPNDQMVDRLLEHIQSDWRPDQLSWWRTWSKLSENKNERIVDFFLSHKQDIDWFLPSLWKHPSERMTQYLLDHHLYHMNEWLFSQNQSHTAACYLIAHPYRIYSKSASANPNELLLSYLIEHPHLLSFDDLCRNPNPMALSYVLQFPERIIWANLCTSTNPALFHEDKIATRKDVCDWVKNVLM